MSSLDIYPILSGTLSLELDGSVAGSELPFPTLLGRDDSDAFLLAGGKHTTGLPPFVIWRVRYVQDVAVAEEQTTAGQTVVFVRIIVKQSPTENKTNKLVSL